MISFGAAIRVSIRASGWEATGFGLRVRCLGQFQSAPPGGRRPVRLDATNNGLRFNPRLRVGGDYRQPIHDFMIRVSIRASGWEATPTCAS